MRSAIRLGLLIVLIAYSLSAATLVTNCTLDAANATCFNAGMFSFADSLDWGAANTLLSSTTGQSGFGTAQAGPDNPHDVSIAPWQARSGGDVNIFASMATGFSGDERLSRWDNTFWGYGPVTSGASTINTFESLNTLTSPNTMLAFAGHFNANPTSLDPNQLGEHLLGAVNGNGALVLRFDRELRSIGFNIASFTSSDFTATLEAFNGLTLIETYSITVTGGGGATCTSLSPASPTVTAPTPCNDAAFVGLDVGALQRITSIQIRTSDRSGFLINGLEFSEVPEPGATFLMTGGLSVLGFWYRSRRRRVAQSR